MRHGRIYKLVDKRNPDVFLYAGSTWEKLNRRWSFHKNKAKQHPDRKIYKYIHENGGVDCFELILLEEGMFEDRHSREMREEHYRVLHNAPLNIRKCSRGDITKKEYEKQYQEDNKYGIQKKKKQYYMDNKEKFLEQAKTYYEDNKVRIAKRAATKVNCLCGLPIAKSGVARHRLTKIHRGRMQARALAGELIDDILKTIAALEINV